MDPLKKSPDLDWEQRSLKPPLGFLGMLECVWQVTHRATINSITSSFFFFFFFFFLSFFSFVSSSPSSPLRCPSSVSSGTDQAPPAWQEAPVNIFYLYLYFWCHCVPTSLRGRHFAFYLCLELTQGLQQQNKVFWGLFVCGRVRFGSHERTSPCQRRHLSLPQHPKPPSPHLQKTNLIKVCLIKPKTNERRAVLVVSWLRGRNLTSWSIRIIFLFILQNRKK